MVRPTIQIIKKNSLFLILPLFLYLIFIKNSFAEPKLAFGTFIVTATITSKCETTASEPQFVDDAFQSIQIVSDVTVVCNNDSKPVIKIISKNIRELLDNNYALRFKKNNGDIVEVISDTLLARLKSNSSSMIDFEEETFTLKKNVSEKIKKINFDVPKLINSKIDNAKLQKFQNNPIIFEISY
jgi:hypothetical protein